MSSDRTHGGFRILYPRAETRWCDQPTVVYVIDHSSAGGYDFTVISPFHGERMGQQQFFSDIEQRSDVLSPPDALAELAWSEWQRHGADGVRRVLDQMAPDRKRSTETPAVAGEGRHE